MSTPDYVSIRLRAEPVEKLRRLTRQLSARLDRDVSQSDMQDAAMDLCFARLDELAERMHVNGPATPNPTAREGND